VHLAELLAAAQRELGFLARVRGEDDDIGAYFDGNPDGADVAPFYYGGDPAIDAGSPEAASSAALRYLDAFDFEPLLLLTRADAFYDVPKLRHAGTLAHVAARGLLGVQ